MKQQHCGRPDKHDQHEHRARRRLKVAVCSCARTPCSCPAPKPHRAMPKETFICPGVLVTEGAPPHLSPRVEL